MPMKTKKQEFHKALMKVMKVIDHRSNIPVLRHVLIDARNGVCQLKGTNLEQALIVEIPAEGVFLACLPCKTLTTLIKPDSKSDTSDVVIDDDVDGSKVRITFDDMTTKIFGMDPQDFPTCKINKSDDDDWAEIATWDTKPLLESLSYALLASSNDETRFNLNSVYFDDDNIMATDGHRLHSAVSPAPLSGKSILLGSKIASILKCILPGTEHVLLAKTEKVLRVKASDWRLDTTIMDGKFPEVSQVIPDLDSLPMRLYIDPVILSKALKRMISLSINDFVKIIVDQGKLALAIDDKDSVKAEIDIPTLAGSTHEGEKFEVGVNPTYLLDAIWKSGETIRIGLSHHEIVNSQSLQKPIRIDLAHGCMAVVMPRRD